MTEKPLLFLLHFAGGNCYSFRFLAPFLNDFRVVTPELPGRGKRFNEILLRDFNEAAKDIYRQMSPRISSAPFVIYGHSMGACLALKVCNMLEAVRKRPQCMIVSGNPGPGIAEDKVRYLMPRHEFIEELRVLGGFPPEVLDNEEVFGFFEPVLRADFELTEKDPQSKVCRVSTPIFAMMGDREENAEKVSNWSRFTSSGFLFEIMRGDHFFIHHHPGRIAQIIRSCLDKVPVSGELTNFT